MPLSKIESKSVQAYELESECKKSGEQCIEIGSEPELVTAGYASLTNDWGPESEVEICDGQMLCQTALEQKNCGQLQKFIDADFTRVYCVELLGKILVKDVSGYASYKTGKAQLAALQAGKSQVKVLRECLAGVIDLLVLRNAQKGLSTEQVNQMVQTYQPIMSLLQAVSGLTAKLKISEVVADGVMVTEADKVALTQEIDKCLGL